MQKNVASQKWIVFAFDRTDNTPKTGDASQITAEISKNGAAGGGNITDTNPTELEDGYYVFDLDQGETNADLLALLPESSTGNIQVIAVPGAVYTTEPNRNKLSVDANGRIDVIKIAGTTQTANDNGADINEILIDVTGLNGDAMKGTNGANTTVPDAAGVAPTVGEIKTAIEAGGSSLAQILADTNAIDILTKAAGVGDLALILNLIEADKVIDISGVPWVLEYRKKVGKAVLLRQELKDTGGSDISSTAATLGQKILE